MNPTFRRSSFVCLNLARLNESSDVAYTMGHTSKDVTMASLETEALSASALSAFNLLGEGGHN
jgi:hypothetical protein